MERQVALKKLRNLLGKNFGYQVNPKALAKDERDAARKEQVSAVALRNELGARAKARSDALLAGDEEYQKISAEWKAMREKCDALTGKLLSHKICVGTSNKFFFHVAADGDSWEEVIAKVIERKKKKELILD